MLGTIFSIICALFVAFHAYEVPTAFAPINSPFFLICSLVLLFISLVKPLLLWPTIVRTQYKIMACAQELYLKDKLIPLSLLYLFVFCLYSLYITLDGPSSSNTAALLMVYSWIIGFGIGFDLLRAAMKRLLQYSQVSFLMQKIATEVEVAVKQKEESKAMQWLEVSIESAARATMDGRINLASNALASLEGVIESYVKEVARAQVTGPFVQESNTPTFTDKVSYLAIFVCERLQWVFETALQKDMQPIADAIISQLGKLSVFFAKHNTNVASLPLSFLMKCGEIAQKQQETEVVTRALLTLSETAKSLISHAKERNESIRDLILTALMTLEQLVKTMFKQSKDINPVLLMQPFAEIGQFIGQDNMRTFPDREEILGEIRRVLNEFQALQIVTKNMESMAPAVGEDTTSSYRQDKPYTP